MLPLGIALVFVVVALVAWALQLMQSAMDQGEFSLMLAGCMVCSAAVGLATVMVMTLSGLPLWGPAMLKLLNSCSTMPRPATTD